VQFILQAPSPETNHDVWTTFGFLSYILLVSLLEASLLFCFIFALGFLIPKSWGEIKRFNILILILTFYMALGLVGQLSYRLDVPVSEAIIYIAINLSNTRLYRRIAFGSLVLVITGIVSCLIWAGYRFDLNKPIESILDRVELLSYFYLGFDAIAFILVLMRNLNV
jgi:hypothetical protein